MAQHYFAFKKFTVHQDKAAMKVTTPACLFGAWSAEKISGHTHFKTAADIGTGTGLLSLMVAQKNDLQIDAIEIDHEAALQANENIRTSGFNSINVIEGDINELQLPLYDCIFSNPPFYENELKSPDAGRNKAHHSEDLSWEELFAFIKEHLAVKGKFFLLLPAKRIKDLERLAEANHLYLNEIIYVKPTPSQTASWIMVEGGEERSTLLTSEMIIREEGYSPGFIALLKDYYLKL